MNNNIATEICFDTKSANILIVDDEPANIKLLEKFLRMQGYDNLVSTTRPEETAVLLSKHNSDLILLDLNMPGMNGYAVIEQLKNAAMEHYPAILVLTASDIRSERIRALDVGARDFVSKPFDAAELLLRVRNLLEVQMAQKHMRNQNDFLEQKVRIRTKDIYDARLKIVRYLGRAAEYRDNETGLHIVRMSKISVLLGSTIGMAAEQCELLLHAAPMHDIGKIGIPDHILLKPGKLNAQEWEIMKTHTHIGSEILSGDESDLMAMAHDIAISHHEKWDGSGYPYNLKGSEIPVVGRVCALADVFDALTSDRPYKKAWSIGEAVDYIVDEREKHFDPLIVEAFIENIDGVLKIISKYAEPRNVNKIDHVPSISSSSNN